MAVNKGLLSLVENTPNFSNQALENAVNTLKVGWVTKSFELDSVIASNAVLTTSQKNDLKDDINNIAHLNLGRTLGDLVRHSATIIDGSIIPGDPNILTGDQGQGSFLEILQTVQSIQGLIPDLLGVNASAKKRGINDHLGTINNIFSNKGDSSDPVFESLLKSINAIVTADLATETALETAYDNLKEFINGVVADSTDFQQTLDAFATAVATAHTNLNNALAAEPLLTHRNNIITQRNNIDAQVALENSNITTIRTYVASFADTLAFTSLAENETLKGLMSNVAQDTNWQTYFNNYNDRTVNDNPIYNTQGTDDEIVKDTLQLRGLPDVTDSVDLDSVADKARRDSRLRTVLKDSGKTSEQLILSACEILNIPTQNFNIYDVSDRLLQNMNNNDVEIIKNELSSHRAVNTFD